MALAWIRVGTANGAVTLIAGAAVVTMMLAAAAWLLLTKAASETEERVFAVSALLLVGGVADALSLSALFGGLVAGVFWRLAGRQPRESVRRDVLFVQHPLLVLVLLLAGARAELSPAAWMLGAGYLAARVIAQLAGSTLVREITDARRSGRSRFAVAAARGVRRGVRAERGGRRLAPTRRSRIAAVVIGTIGSELVVVIVRLRRTA